MTDPNAIESRIARMEESDFEWALERRRRYVPTENQYRRQQTDTEVAEQLAEEKRYLDDDPEAVLDAMWDRVREGRSAT